MKTPEEGLAAVVYAPCTVKATVRNQPLTVTVRTEYPFKDTVDIIVHTDAPVTFALHLRVPAWAEGATVTVDGVTQDALAGAFHVVSRGWDGDDAVTLRLPMPIRGERRFNDSIAISRGPLVYALKIQEEWRRLRGEKPDEYWEVQPKTAWNYALQWDPDNPDSSIAFTERELGPMPFSQDGAPVLATVKGRRLPGWGLDRNAAAPPPVSPATSNEPLEELTLIPYGCARLRVTEFPVLE